jgi:hypothetical protein
MANAAADSGSTAMPATAAAQADARERNASQDARDGSIT